MVYPIAEIFHSIQGEGQWTGTPMMFVRLAGCNVGKYSSPSDTQSWCTAFDGNRFLCDTDYHLNSKMGEGQLVDLLQGETHVCVSGGEPFLHDLNPLVRAFQQAGCMVHIETSCTLPFKLVEPNERLIWITGSPKAGYQKELLDHCNEVKLLVNDLTDMDQLKELINSLFEGMIIYIQPINYTYSLDSYNMKLAENLVKGNPARLRLSLQLHKPLGAR